MFVGDADAEVTAEGVVFVVDFTDGMANKSVEETIRQFIQDTREDGATTEWLG